VAEGTGPLSNLRHFQQNNRRSSPWKPLKSRVLSELVTTDLPPPRAAQTSFANLLLCADSAIRRRSRHAPRCTS